MPLYDTGSSFYDYMKQRGKRKSDLLAELSPDKKITPAERKKIEAKITEEFSPKPFPPGDTAAQMDYEASDREETRQRKQAALKSKTKKKTEPTPPATPSPTPEPKESGVRNTVDMSSEIAGNIQEGLDNLDQEMCESNLRRLFSLGPNYVAKISYEGQYDLCIMNCRIHVAGAPDNLYFYSIGDALKEPLINSDVRIAEKIFCPARRKAQEYWAVFRAFSTQLGGKSTGRTCIVI